MVRWKRDGGINRKRRHELGKKDLTCIVGLSGTPHSNLSCSCYKQVVPSCGKYRELNVTCTLLHACEHIFLLAPYSST
jgi:hypothetical protein